MLIASYKKTETPKIIEPTFPWSDVDSVQLSTHFTVGDFTTAATFPHKLVPNLGLSEYDLIVNMAWLATNVLEPLYTKYPGFNINSGFRNAQGKSQHNKAQAVDLQWPNHKKETVHEIAVWMAENLPYDQLIFEHGNGIWIHISFDKDKTQQRREVLTQYKNKYEFGIKNYFA